MNQDFKNYLSPTEMINSDHKKIIQHALDIVKDFGEDQIEKAVKIYYAVRDEIWYDPYSPFYLPEHYRASNVLKNGRGYCVPKASLLCALGRACGIPSRLGFADVRNHLATKQLIEFFGCDLFVYHGFVEFYLDKKWVIATPAFNVELCKRHNVAPLEFDGHEDSLFHEFNQEKKLFMQYVTYHGSYGDVPLEAILRAWEEAYGKVRIDAWIAELEKTGGKSSRNFDTETVINT
jgi:transglutaminase-like putative cysteine protease